MIKTTFFLPETLKNKPIWALWRLEEQNGRTTKIPYQVNGRRASHSNPATWTTYQNAVNTLNRRPEFFHGVSSAMSKQYRTIFIDIDHCIDAEGHFDDRAKDILDAFVDDNGDLTTFVEVSQSGTGLHLILIGDIPRSFKNSRHNVEMYDDKRFVAMTGKAFSAREPIECKEGIDYVFKRYKTPSRALETDWTSRPIDPATRREDDWIIRHASDRDGSRFSALFNGDWSSYSSRSEADIALCCILAFWTNNDAEAINRLFRRSGLYRAKWEREDYRTTTIKNAVAHNDDTLSQFIGRRRHERGVAMLGLLND